MFTLTQLGYIISITNKEKVVITMTNVEKYLQSLNKASEKVVKIENTLKKHQTKLEKLLKQLSENGVNLDLSHIEYIDSSYKEFNIMVDFLKPYMHDSNGHASQMYWELCEVESKIRDIRSNYQKLKDANRVVENWNTKLNKQIEKDNLIKIKTPDVIIEFVNGWGKRAYEWHKSNPKNRMTEKELIKWIDQAKQEKIAALTIAVQDITGDITDARMLTIANNGCLNGVIHGVNGSAHVETILAGGYNIQCLHYRTLVHKF